MKEVSSQKDDIGFLEQFREKEDKYLFLGYAPVERPSGHEFDAYALQELQGARKNHQFQQLRREVAQMKPRVKAILESLGLTLIVYNYPPPAVGGPVLTYNMIDQITDNDSDFRLEKDKVFDVLDQAIGALKVGLPRTTPPKNSEQRKELFIVHGHDEAAKEAVSRFVEKLGLKALILHEQPNRGRTIIEKFEDYSNVEMAIVIITADDVGAKRDSATKLGELKPRARQDVIFELGFFSGKLGRSRVCVLYKEGVELPSDYHGVVYIPLDSSGAWRLKLAREIRSAGIYVDMNKAI